MQQCDCCGKHAERFHQHHVLPRVLGGIDAASNKVKVCIECHGLLHGNREQFKIRNLSRVGVIRARKLGVVFGAPRLNKNRTGWRKQYDPAVVARIMDRTTPMRTLAVELGISPAKVCFMRKRIGVSDG